MKSLIKNSRLLLIASAIAIASCNNESDSKTSTTGTDSAGTSDKKNSSADSSKAMGNPDQDAINYAVPKNATEIAWLMAGIKMGTSKELKEHARMMLADHKKMDGEVSALVSKKGWTMPTIDTANAVNVTETMGKGWDMAWTDKMIAEHTDIVEHFTKAKGDVKDEDFRALITKSIPVVQSHLDMLKAMKDKMK